MSNSKVKSILVSLYETIGSFPFFLRNIIYQPKSKTYLFLAINGAGLGHLTRCLAVARRIKKIEPDAEIIFFMTSIAVPLVHKEGFKCHHITPMSLAGEHVTALKWNKLFSSMLKDVIKLHKPSKLIFDGTVPYIGLNRIIKGFQKIETIWIKRGLSKNTNIECRIKSALDTFDMTIVPGELSHKEYDSEKIKYVNPVIYIDKSEFWTRSEFCKEFGLDEERKIAYVQLGAGNINDIDNIESKLITILKSKNIQVVIGSSPISLSTQKNLGADLVLKDYPNSKYFPLFDISFLASGYNSVYEAIYANLPTVFIPNTATGSDNQELRAQLASKHIDSICLGWETSDWKYEISNFLSKICSSPYKDTELFENGAKQAATLVVRSEVIK